MRVQMTFRQKKVFFLGLGIMAAGLVAMPILNRFYAYSKQVDAEIERQKNNIWIAAGIVTERARQGHYQDYDQAHTDFEFERIRLMEEQT